MNVLTSVAVLFLSISLVQSTNIVLTNDDGWAVAMIRQQYATLIDAGYDVVLASPAENESGTGSSSATPTVLKVPCEFDTCPVGSPPEGFNASEPTLNYINSFPVNAVAFGIQTLAPQFFGGPPDFVVSGPNVGNNLGQSSVDGSGTVGAACEAALLGIPSTAFSAAGLSQVAYTDLGTNDADTFAAVVSAGITVKYLDALLADGKPFLPPQISINMNWPAPTPTTCPNVDAYSFILTRIAADASVIDVETCGTDHLPQETDVVDMRGCFVSVSVMDAASKTDVDAATQAVVLERLGSILSCIWPM
ncbi:sure-like protein [Gymnopus androsaceus JB14]|uniref:Sure-like protein n=1 Tax=Gymnopus androsaceus JB14 TaxID=1447944 RepID=A0A6A4HR11_9AGAR|nr:sure-like protein [Gymnopus androsaceus JB14]